ncbi:MAG: SRPBCC family protein [Bacteroidia bacterium]|nr:SRPBCC family protein [Bacteroidia bacterium]
MLETLQTNQLIKCDIKTVWDFMSSPANLAAITPDYMGFEILNDLHGDKMYPGQIIEYYVKPVLGIKLHWVTEITHVKDYEFFVDEQRYGPYAFWHHKHFLKEVNQGVEMIDLVHYRAPFGPIGKLANAIFIKRQLKEVFDYRYKKIDELFNTN